VTGDKYADVLNKE